MTDPVPVEPIGEVTKLRELLHARQELDRAQSDRITALEQELGATQAKLRAAQEEIRRLETMLHGFSPGAAPALIARRPAP